MKSHHLHAGVGHYGVFNGKRWEAQVYPVLHKAIQSSRQLSGDSFSLAGDAVYDPFLWSGTTIIPPGAPLLKARASEARPIRRMPRGPENRRLRRSSESKESTFSCIKPNSVL
jgi:hypothetical protein